MEFCGFLSYINKNQPQVHPCPFPTGPPSCLPPHPTLQPLAEPLFEFPESYSKFPLAICFTMLLSSFISPSPSSSPTVSIGQFSMSVSPLLQHVRSLVGTFEFSVAACGIQILEQGSNLGPLCWKHRILATGPPGSPSNLFFIDQS